jgi:hypothetical protein
MKHLYAFIILGIAFSAELVFADNFRCPNDNIVSTGDSISTVASKCDKPDFIFKREEPVTVVDTRDDGTTRPRTIYVEVQEWIYNQGLSHTLIFRNGIFSEIRFGGFAK